MLLAVVAAPRLARFLVGDAREILPGHSAGFQYRESLLLAVVAAPRLARFLVGDAREILPGHSAVFQYRESLLLAARLAANHAVGRQDGEDRGCIPLPLRRGPCPVGVTLAHGHERDFCILRQLVEWLEHACALLDAPQLSEMGKASLQRRQRLHLGRNPFHQRQAWGWQALTHTQARGKRVKDAAELGGIIFSRPRGQKILRMDEAAYCRSGFGRGEGITRRAQAIEIADLGHTAQRAAQRLVC